MSSSSLKIPPRFFFKYLTKTTRRFFQPDQAARICHLQVVSTGSSEVPPSICVSTGYGRYLFNCPELLQSALKGRGGNEASMRANISAATLSHIFITKTSWENIGGIPGITLLLKDMGWNHVCPPITGPHDLKMFPYVVNSFVNPKVCPIRIAVATNGAKVFENLDLKVTAVELTTPNITTPTLDSILENNNSNNNNNNTDYTKSTSIFAYVLQLASVRGKFHPERADALGVQPGRQYSQLVKGHPIIVPATGRKVYPHEVMDPEISGLSMLILECPSSDYVPSLVEHPLLQSNRFNPVLIAHTTPREVFEMDEYQDWMRRYKDTKNLLVHSDFCPPEMATKSYNLQLPLHLIDSELFRLPNFVSKQDNSNANIMKDPSIIISQNFLKFHIRPLAKFGTIENQVLKSRETLVSDTLKVLRENPDFMDQLRIHPKVKSNFDSILDCPLDENYSQEDNFKSDILKFDPSKATMTSPPPRVTFLGTGATNPTMIRGTSSILMHLPNGDYMMLDAGEGTLSQLYKCFGPCIADEILRKLKCVFVSHIHGDHHLGLTQLIQKREKLTNNNFDFQPLVILGPWLLLNSLRSYNNFCESIPYNFTVSRRDTPLPSVLQDTGLSHMELIPVVHTRESYGIVLYFGENQWKVVYSGDTRPCQKLIQAGKGASLLIHETTYHNSMLEKALVCRHTTDTEVLQVASEMGAQCLVSTHFSQRYTKPLTPRDIQAKSSGVTMDMFGSLWSNGAVVGFDFMSVRLDELERLRELNPIVRDVLTSLVINETEEGDEVDCI